MGDVVDLKERNPHEGWYCRCTAVKYFCSACPHERRVAYHDLPRETFEAQENEDQEHPLAKRMRLMEEKQAATNEAIYYSLWDLQDEVHETHRYQKTMHTRLCQVEEKFRLLRDAYNLIGRTDLKLDTKLSIVGLGGSASSHSGPPARGTVARRCPALTHIAEDSGKGKGKGKSNEERKIVEDSGKGKGKSKGR